MDPLLPRNAELPEAEADQDEDERKKIQFSVPCSAPPQLDPRQVEMIRRRRPTPATLFRLTDPPSPEDETQWMLTDNGVLKSRLTHTYQPPSLKVVQKMAQAHLACLPSMDKDDSEEEADGGCEETKELRGDEQKLPENSARPDKSTEPRKHHQPRGETEPQEIGKF
ncbi:unnamed protein product [Knipowitschia caucasica]